MAVPQACGPYYSSLTVQPDMKKIARETSKTNNRTSRNNLMPQGVVLCFESLLAPSDLSLDFRCLTESECRDAEGFLESVLGLTWTEAAAAAALSSFVVGAICCIAIARFVVSNGEEKNVQASVLCPSYCVFPAELMSFPKFGYFVQLICSQTKTEQKNKQFST